MVIVKEEGTVLWVNFGRPIVTNGDFVACESDVLFPNYIGMDFVSIQPFCRNTLSGPTDRLISTEWDRQQLCIPRALTLLIVSDALIS